MFCDIIQEIRRRKVWFDGVPEGPSLREVAATGASWDELESREIKIVSDTF